MRITMIGHSTLLREGSEMRLLTDPYFGTAGHIAYARVHPPARKREEQRDIDTVLVSHAHWDHTDRNVLRSLDPSVPVLAPAGISMMLNSKASGRSRRSFRGKAGSVPPRSLRCRPFTRERLAS